MGTNIENVPISKKLQMQSEKHLFSMDTSKKWTPTDLQEES